MRGRKPLPRAIKDLRAGRRTLTGPPAGPVSPPPECPAWLDAAARDEWARVAPGLAELGLLTRVDLAALAAYCQCFAQWQMVTLQLRQDGLVTRGSTGQPRAHPLINYQKELLLQMRAYAVEFGFTPSSRSRLDVRPPSGERDELEEFLDG